MPSIRPSYQSLIITFQQAGLPFAAAGATPTAAVAAPMIRSAARIWRSERITETWDRPYRSIGRGTLVGCTLRHAPGGTAVTSLPAWRERPVRLPLRVC